MAKKWPEKVIQKSFIKGHSFPYRLYYIYIEIREPRSRFLYLKKSKKLIPRKVLANFLHWRWSAFIKKTYK